MNDGVFSFTKGLSPLKFDPAFLSVMNSPITSSILAVSKISSIVLLGILPNFGLFFRELILSTKVLIIHKTSNI